MLRHKFKPTWWTRYALAWLLAVLTPFCAPFSTKTSGSPEGATGSGTGQLGDTGLNPEVWQRYTDNPFANSDHGIPQVSAKGASGRLFNAQLLWAAAQCSCTPKLTERFLVSNAVTAGSLPQILMPPIRQAVASDGELQTLMNLPAGIGGLLGSIFASDSKISAKVRAGLETKLERFTPGGTHLSQRLAFTFDGLIGASAVVPSLTAAGAGAAAGTKSTASFAIDELTPRWQLVLKTPGLWDAGAPAALGDHGLQVLETLRLLTEWQYLLGLAQTPSGGVAGGLTLSLADGGSRIVGAFTTTTDASAAPFLDGVYSVTLPQGTAVSVALAGGEIWGHQPAPINLAAQARLWDVAATAFTRLHPTHRGQAASLFGDDGLGLLPQKSHELALAFLPGMQALLSGPFIDQGAQQIFATARVPGSDAAPSRLANLLELTRLTRALNDWQLAMNQLDSAGLDAATLARVSGGKAGLLAALQLSLQTLLHTAVTTASGTPALILDSMNAAPGQDSDDSTAMETAAETAATLLATANSTVQSEFLTERAVALTHWYVRQYLAPLFLPNTQSGAAAAVSPRPAPKVSLTALLWTQVMFRELTSFGKTAEAPWLADAQTAVAGLIAAADLAAAN